MKGRLNLGLAQFVGSKQVTGPLADADTTEQSLPKRRHLRLWVKGTVLESDRFMIPDHIRNEEAHILANR